MESLGKMKSGNCIAEKEREREREREGRQTDRQKERYHLSQIPLHQYRNSNSGPQSKYTILYSIDRRDKFSFSNSRR